VPVADAGAATGSGTAGPGTTAGSVGVAAGPVVAAAGALTSAVDRLLRLLAGSYGLAVTDPGRLVDVFVRSGYVPLSPPSQDVAVNLSVLESMPLLAALAGLAGPAVARSRRSVRRLRDRPLAGALAYAKRTSSPEPVAVLDAFAVAYAVGLLGLFLGRLPAHHMLTVRYLHPLYALGVYWLVRTPAVRRAVGSAGRRLAAAAVAGLAVGVPGYVGALVLLGTTLGEGVQLYALVALCVAATVAVASLRAAGGTDDDVRTLAVALGVAAGISAAFLLVSGVVLFATADEFLLPLGRVVHRVAGGVAVGHPL
jgi:hypothetical protein